MCRFFLTTLFFSFFFGLQSQHALKGVIQDSLTGKPVGDAVITVAGTTINVFSGKDGQFNLMHSEPECQIIVWQAGYQTRKFILTEKQGTVVSITRLQVNLEEVTVSSAKFRVVQAENNTNFLGVSFYDNLLLALVSKGMGKNANFIQVLNLNGDLLSEKIAPKYSVSLYKDCLGNVQVLTADSVYQVYYDYQKISFLSPYHLSDFYSSIYRCQIYNNNTYYFKDQYYRNLKSVYSYISEYSKTGFQSLYTVSDSNAISSFNSDYNLQYFLGKRRISGDPPWNVSTIVANLDQLRENEPLPESYSNLLRPVESEIYCLDSCISIFDYTNKRRLDFNFSNQLQKKESLGVDATVIHHAIIDNDFKRIYFIGSARKNVVYEYLSNGTLKLREKLEQFNFVKNVMVKGNVLYFLYRPAATSNHQKLYIYRLQG